MSRVLEGSILVRDGSELRRVAKWSIEGDGSLYIHFVRDGVVEQAYSTKSSETPPLQADDRIGKSRARKLTYHTTGRVHLEHRRGKAIYLEPLTRLTAVTSFAQYHVPKISGLDLHDGHAGDSDLVIDSCLNQSLELAFLAAPHNIAFDPPLPGIIFNNYFALYLNAAQYPMGTPELIRQCFTILLAQDGYFASQPIPEDQAFLEYKQRMTGVTGVILFPPASNNDRGVYRVVPAVPMRTCPRIEVEFFDQALTAVQDEGVSSRRANVDIRFRVKGPGGFLQKPVAIRSITLDAEIY